jgi:hypothetical protein
MGKTLQVRDVSDETYSSLSRQAAERGQSLSQYLRDELDEIASRHDAMERSIREIRALKAKLKNPLTREEIVAAIHEGRGE